MAAPRAASRMAPRGAPRRRGARTLATRVWRSDGGTTPGVWSLAEEVPVEVRLAGEPYAVMMVTPADLGDFAIGFALTEGIVADAGAIARVTIQPLGIGFSADLTLAAGAPRADRGRALTGATGCGICGAGRLDAAIRQPVPVPAAPPVAPEAIRAALHALAGHQPLNRETRSVHAAGLADRDGTVRLVREDVGRHNALDKLIGRLAAEDRLPVEGFLVMSSRCSFELVQKASVAGAPLLATISAPTALAVDYARACGMKLAALGPDDAVVMVD